MNIMDMGILFVQFSDLPDSQREAFLRQHPEILNEGMVDWALMAARMREPEAKRRIANGALYLATKLGDTQRQAAARKILAGG